jgi:hypothetical protein
MTRILRRGGGSPSATACISTCHLHRVLREPDRGQGGGGGGRGRRVPPDPPNVDRSLDRTQRASAKRVHFYATCLRSLRFPAGHRKRRAGRPPYPTPALPAPRIPSAGRGGNASRAGGSIPPAGLNARTQWNFRTRAGPTPSQTIPCGRTAPRACPPARRCGLRSSRAGPGAGSPAAARSDSCRSTRALR